MKFLVSCFATFALACGAHGEVRPFTIDHVLADLAGTHPQASRVSDALPDGVTAFEDVAFVRRPEGLLRLDVYRPAGDDVRPAVLLVHGGGWLTGDRTMERPLAQQLALRGWVAVPVSYRLGPAGRFPAPLLDLKAAVRWLRTHAGEYHVDPERIAVLGGSAGGTLAALLGATNGREEFELERAAGAPSAEVQAVVDVDGTATFMDNALIRASETRPDNPYLEFLHGPYRRQRTTWLDASPLLHVGPRSAPTLFLRSTVTQPILVGREEMAERLRILGVRAEVITYPDTPHPFWLVHPWFDQVVTDTDRFLREVLNVE